MGLFSGIASLVGASGGIADKYLGSAYNAHLQRDLMSNQNTLNLENWHKQLTEGPTLQRQGLEAAGYNPLLALSSGGVSTPSIGGVSALSASHGNSQGWDTFGESMKDIEEASLVKDEKKVKSAQVDNLKKDNQLKDALKDKAEADATKTKVETFVEPVRALSAVGGTVATAYGAKKIHDMFKDKGSVRGLNSIQRQRIEQLRKVVKAASRRNAPSLGSKVLQSLGIFSLPLLPAASAYQMNKYLHEVSPSARKIIDTPNFGSRLR